MILTNFEKNVFQSISKFYTILWRFPIQWDIKYDVFFATRFPSKSWILTYTFLFISFLLVVASGGVAIGFRLLSKPNFARINALVLLITSGVYGVVLISIYLVLSNLKLMLFCFNNIIIWATEIENELEKPKINNQKNPSFSEALHFIAVPGMFFATGFVPFAYVLSGHEALYYLFEELLGNPMYRSNTTIFISFILRVVFYFISNVEAIRCIAYLYCIGLIFLSRCGKIITLTILYCKNSLKFHQIYKIYRIYWSFLEPTVSKITYVLLTFLFWLIVVFGWILVKASANLIGELVYLWLYTSCILGCLGGYVFITQVCSIFEKLSGAVPLNVLRAKIGFSKTHNTQNRIILLETRAVIAIRLKYGFFGYFGSALFGDLVLVLTMRICDAILTFDYI